MGVPLNPSSDFPSSTLSNSINPSMSSSNSKTLETQIDAETIGGEELERESGESRKIDGDRGGEEEEGECGFCLFMKGGGCKDSFIAWENCIKEGEKKNEDIVEKCFEVTRALHKCMEAHSEYYEPLLRAEKVAEEEAMKELAKEKEKEAVSQSSDQIVVSKDSGDLQDSAKDPEQQVDSKHG